MKTAQSLLDQIAASKDALRNLGVTRIGIFGSAARGEATGQSDIDFLVDYDPQKKTYRNFYGTATLLESLFNRPVDVVTESSLSPYIKPHILKDITYVQIAD